MTKDLIMDGGPIMIEDDCIGDVIALSIRLASSIGTPPCTRARPECCSTSSAAVLGVSSLGFGNRTPSEFELPPRDRPSMRWGH